MKKVFILVFALMFLMSAKKLVARMRCANCMIFFETEIQATEHLNTPGNEAHEFTVRYVGVEE